MTTTAVGSMEQASSCSPQLRKVEELDRAAGKEIEPPRDDVIDLAERYRITARADAQRARTPPDAAFSGSQLGFAARPRTDLRRSRLAVDTSAVAKLDVEPGTLPETMAAWVIRQEREGEPKDAFQLEEIEVPEPGAFEVIVRVMAAGVNFNNVWAALGKPVSVFGYGDHPEYGHHIGGSDASGIVWKVGEGVTTLEARRRGRDPLQPGLLRGRRGARPRPARRARARRSGATRRPGAPSPSSPRSRRSSCCRSPQNLSWAESSAYGLTYFTAYRMLIDQCKLQAGPQRPDLGRRRRPRRLRHPALQGGRRQRGRRRLLRREGRAGQAARRRRLHQPQRVRRDDADRRRTSPTRAAEKERFKASRGFAKRVKEILGDAPDIVFEHVGQATFPTSVFVVKPFGKVVICGATSGYTARLRRPLPVDAPEADHRLALRQRLRVHARERADGRGQDPAGALADDGLRGRRRGAPAAAREQAPRQDLDPGRRRVSEDEGKNEEGPGAIRAEVGA